MAEISKISAVAIANVAKVDGLAKASILDINGVAVPSAFTGLLDESYASGAAAAFSVRRLYSQYTGACMRVRRASDNVEGDVGFDSNNELGLTSPISNTSDAQSYTDLADFVDHTGTPTSAFVRYWYDQSQAGGTGTGNDYFQATAGEQPRIYNGTAVESDNSKPALYFVDGTSNEMDTALNISSEPLSVFQVMRKDSTASRAAGVQTSTAAPYRDGWVIACDATVIRAWYDTDGGQGYSFVNVTHDGTTQSLQSMITSGTNIDFRINGGTSATNTNLYDSTEPLWLHGWYPNQGARIQEIIVYTSDVGGSNRGSIETNIDNHFLIPGM